MAETDRALIDTALRLPESERAELAVRLIDSLDPTVDADAEAAWAAEIAERLADLDAGRVIPVPCTEARRRIESDRPVE